MALATPTLPRAKKTVNSSLSDANLEFYTLSETTASPVKELVKTTSSSDFSIENDQITINSNTPLFMWVPALTSKNEGESYTRATYQLQFKPKLRAFNTEKTTASKWYFADPEIVSYIADHQKKDTSIYSSPIVYKIGIPQPSSDYLLEYSISGSLSAEINSKNSITGVLNPNELPADLTNYTLVPVTTHTNEKVLYLVGGKDSSGNAVDTIYKSSIEDGSLGPWQKSGLSLPTPLYNVSCVFSSNTASIYIAGGNTDTGTYSSAIYSAYSSSGGGSVFQAPLNTSNTSDNTLPVGLENAALITINIDYSGYLIVAGGNNSSPSNAIYAVPSENLEFGKTDFFTLSQTLPFSGFTASYSFNYYNDPSAPTSGDADTFFLLGDDGTNTYLVTYNSNLPSNDSTDTSTPLTLSLNTYKLPYLGATTRNSFLTSFNGCLVFVNEKNGTNTLFYLPLSSVMSKTAISGITEISSVESFPLNQINNISGGMWAAVTNMSTIFSIGGSISGSPTRDVVNFDFKPNLDYYLAAPPFSALYGEINKPNQIIPTHYYFLDPIKAYNILSSATPRLTPTQVYNKTINQNTDIYHIGNTILNSQNNSYYTEVISYDSELKLFTLKLTIFGQNNYSSGNFIFNESIIPFFFIPFFLFNNINPDPTKLTNTSVPNTVYTLFENIMEGTVITGLSLLLEGTKNNSSVPLTSSSSSAS